MKRPFFQRKLPRIILLVAVILGLLECEAQALEWGLGAGRIQGCLARVNDEEALCSMGPAMTLSLGANLWGKNYRPEQQERESARSSNSSGQIRGNFDLGIKVDRWEELAIIILAVLFLTTIGYALLYPFSSRADIGLIGRSGWQQQAGNDLQLFRNEVGIYLRAYLSQHFPMYIYGSGMISHQNITIDGEAETRQVFVKGIGFGFMSPTRGGLYLRGIWERSTLLDPSARDLLKDASEVKALRNSVAEILDGSYFELGYIWHY